ncbi:universal stress protein [Lactiplantibacillus mudanjiangensis]|uniref:Universal stress protein n=1 Tax=Lactiplantibacillus mudanjiangensis TaxID=1296538 RepID=A0A660E1S2_9LACO|nr:universal stress protein [Lactiplantibacillus mudanjiangensis]VDG17603.1 universal stress protein UspA [Lactobacillus sp.] [Lactiplantibacillus mudanjiangensis]VDG23145.1 universal stress protein UspA [Lactobacillus sp.] [Lactiplantibacillus mudanjiangensis]VDG29594.1 universal stress protein UspA [Lactobacillus sp.] [Lactiplantibacillus mudanjiangensis]VDG32708.1 universal stress protein UspA [Lactobacillus sp.] [Lactiplantibacillus mudanjiangensis]
MPSSYTHVLVPVDSSAQAQAAFDEAVNIAQRHDAILTALYVVDDSAYHAPALDPVLDELLTAEASHANADMRDRQRFVATTTVSQFKTEVAYGNPKRTISEYAKQHPEIDLIVLGATGKDSPHRVAVGSTTSYVVDHAPCNVIVIR